MIFLLVFNKNIFYVYNSTSLKFKNYEKRNIIFVIFLCKQQETKQKLSKLEQMGLPKDTVLNFYDLSNVGISDGFPIGITINKGYIWYSLKL